ncbi:MAG TPA: efflux RND transporter periplasmic adaptor subunit [Gemmatimonadaceae bacterium]|jgi:multidrug efflux pump subunit AcrA (membrane-fusion protein)|nr:efflux RND transporter periplasmic adaptor subunit [Gemmatimonadaceae bacterium]
MRFVRSRRTLIALAVLFIGAPSAWLLARPAADDGSALVATVRQGDFVVTVTTAGELRASNSVNITGPAEMQRAGAFQVKITSLVPEGTIVKEGDVVAELDRSALAQKMQETMLAVQKAEAVNEQAMLDSTLNLSKAREEIRGMELALEEKRLAKEQAVYEAPTVKRQAEIDLEKAERALTQARIDYKTKAEQAQAKMREVGSDLQRQKNTLDVVQTVMAQFTIKAPAPGMVIYQKEWNGKKRAVGSQVNPWEPTVATLPDLTKMESITYVNEIDIRKVAVGQPVTISLDSDPTKQLHGKIVQVANVGEQRPNTDAKVFEVKVLLSGADTTLRPGMTTGNAIQTTMLKDVLSVPLEAVSSVADVPYVYKRSGGRVVKQEVETGAMNDIGVVLVQGVAAGEEVLLVPPADADKLTPTRLPGSTRGTPAQGGDSSVAPQTVPSPEPAAKSAPEAMKAPAGTKPRGN